MKCSTCDNEVEKFRDELSVKEHAISGCCQDCQDEVFCDFYRGLDYCTKPCCNQEQE